MDIIPNNTVLQAAEEEEEEGVTPNNGALPPPANFNRIREAIRKRQGDPPPPYSPPSPPSSPPPTPPPSSDIFEQLVTVNKEFSEENFQIYLEFKLNSYFINCIFGQHIANDRKLYKKQLYENIIREILIYKDHIVDKKKQKVLIDNFNHLILNNIHSDFHISTSNFNNLYKLTPNDDEVNESNNTKENIINYFVDNFEKSKLFKNFFNNIDNNPLFLLNKIQSLDMEYLKIFYKIDNIRDLSNLELRPINDLTSVFESQELMKYVLNEDKYRKLLELIELSNQTDRPERPVLDLREQTNTRIKSRVGRAAESTMKSMPSIRRRQQEQPEQPEQPASTRVSTSAKRNTTIGPGRIL